ncbi:Histidine transport system permease protein hisQ [Oligella ureolytica]|uniref:ABC transporter permease n=1 Tax=Oligella ureolytica TaxID=90244 RepID=UPI000E033CEC|nr:ABC transporter permease [Oligella ureolytica]SUA55853.1 Histidine transport system permease protein hisQ [Oligella ureolytica]
MFLDGYWELIKNGTWATIQLALLSVLLSFILGLLGASAKLFGGSLLRGIATLYTTIIRSVPDLVLMLLLFFSIQMGLNQVTDALGWRVIQIDPFWAGVIVIGMIYGAYFTETFRGAFLAVPKGQIEVGMAYGMNSTQVFRHILFPQMMRYAIPGIGNNWLVVLKATALVSIIGLSDLVKASQDAGRATGDMFKFILIAGLIYLVLTSLSNMVLWLLERRYSVGAAKFELD